MFDYLQQFNRLPKELRDQVSGPEAMKSLDALEARYGLKLASVVMRLMVKEFAFSHLPVLLAEEFSLGEVEAKRLADELRETVLKKSETYLGLATVSQADDNLDLKIQAALLASGVIFTSEFLIERFRNVVRTYLRGVRTKIDARASFQKPVELGGLGLSPEKVDIIFQSLSSELKLPIAKEVPVIAPVVKTTSKEGLSSLQKEVSELQKLILKDTADSGYNLAQSIAERKKKLLSQKELPAGAKENIAQPAVSVPVKPVEPEKKIEISTPQPTKTIPPVVPSNLPFQETRTIHHSQNIPVSPTVSPISPVFPAAPKAQVSEPVKAATPPLVTKAVPPISKNIVPPITGNKVAIKTPTPSVASPVNKPKIQDIKAAPRVMGPIDELKFLDLVNFRRLGTVPAEATAKLFKKIKLMEHDGYDRMTEGIAAWRQSPVNRLYLSIGQEAVRKMKPLKEISKDRQSNNQEYLSPEEITAIMELNAKLIF